MYIGYVRKSTNKQFITIDHQIDQIKGFSDNVQHIFIEKDTGKNNKRTELNKAIEICKYFDATLLFYKLDRLSRDVIFLFTLKESGIKLRCIQLPELNTLTLGIFATMAQYELEVISERTKEALNKLKDNGVRLGNNNLTDKGRMKSIKTIKENSINNRNWLLAKVFIENYIFKNTKNNINLSGLAVLLNENGYTTRYNKKFTAQQVKRIVEKYNLI